MYKVLLLLIISCSSVSERYVLKGKIRLQGGRAGAQTWKDSMILKRAIWYQSSTLVYDNYIANIRSNSGFSKWFSGSEMNSVRECESLLLSLSNNNFHRVINNTEIISQMSQNGFQQVHAPSFIKNLKMHPDYNHWNLTMYTPRIFCSQQSQKELTLVLPSYNEVKVNI